MSALRLTLCPSRERDLTHVDRDEEWLGERVSVGGTREVAVDFFGLGAVVGKICPRR
jgi:hypothetical protein